MPLLTGKSGSVSANTSSSMAARNATGIASPRWIMPSRSSFRLGHEPRNGEGDQRRSSRIGRGCQDPATGEPGRPSPACYKSRRHKPMRASRMRSSCAGSTSTTTPRKPPSVRPSSPGPTSGGGRSHVNPHTCQAASGESRRSTPGSTRHDPSRRRPRCPRTRRRAPRVRALVRAPIRRSQGGSTGCNTRTFSRRGHLAKSFKFGRTIRPVASILLLGRRLSGIPWRPSTNAPKFGYIEIGASGGFPGSSLANHGHGKIPRDASPGSRIRPLLSRPDRSTEPRCPHRVLRTTRRCRQAPPAAWGSSARPGQDVPGPTGVVATGRGLPRGPAPAGNSKARPLRAKTYVAPAGRAPGSSPGSTVLFSLFSFGFFPGLLGFSLLSLLSR
jgi:hypothetical protein